jgi:signal transduction histidine kinase
MVALNVVGIGGIAMARRGVLEEAERVLRLETSARARAVESLLASTRADLAFLTGSPIFFGLEGALGSRDPGQARWRRLDAEGALLLFLRGHPEVTHLTARSQAGSPLVEAGRRGGVPVLWVPGSGRGAAAARGPDAGTSGSAAGGISGRFGFSVGVRRVQGSVTLEAVVDPSRLMASGPVPDDPSRACALRDRDGGPLAAEAGAPDAGAPASGWILAEAPIRTEGWSAPSPWLLACARRREPAVALLEPFASRYRTTLMLNLAVMSLALLLGGFAIQQGRRRQLLEARAREEARVRELERQLFHTERLSTVGRLAAGMAHEINNPLEGMANYLGLARDALQRGDAAAAQQRLDGVLEGLRRVSGIVRQVLSHAVPADAPRDVLDLNPVLLQTVEFVRSRPEFRALRFDLDLDPGPLRVRGNPALLGQVLLNILVNACEAQPGGGEVRVASRKEDGRVVVECADRGPGVPSADSGRIFEPFYSTKNSTGLGLSICESIVTQHGGELGVEKRPGGGALFRMRFPAAEGENAAGEGAHA